MHVFLCIFSNLPRVFIPFSALFNHSFLNPPSPFQCVSFSLLSAYSGSSIQALPFFLVSSSSRSLSVHPLFSLAPYLSLQLLFHPQDIIILLLSHSPLLPFLHLFPFYSAHLIIAPLAYFVLPFTSFLSCL
jgi:hypothetical protein